MVPIKGRRGYTIDREEEEARRAKGHYPDVLPERPGGEGVQITDIQVQHSTAKAKFLRKHSKDYDDA